MIWRLGKAASHVWTAMHVKARDHADGGLLYLVVEGVGKPAQEDAAVLSGDHRRRLRKQGQALNRFPNGCRERSSQPWRLRVVPLASRQHIAPSRQPERDEHGLFLGEQLPLHVIPGDRQARVPIDIGLALFELIAVPGRDRQLVPFWGSQAVPELLDDVQLLFKRKRYQVRPWSHRVLSNGV